MITSKLISKNKTFLILITLILSIFVVGVIGNILIKDKIKNWGVDSQNKNEKIKVAADQVLTYKQQKLILTKDNLIKKINQVSVPTFSNFHNVLSSDNVGDIMITIFNEKNLIYWNENYFEPILENNNVKFELNETHFSESDINIYLSVADTFSINDTILTVNIYQLIEKNYQLNQDYFEEVSLTNELTDNLGVEFEIVFDPQSKHSKDGRKYSFDIMNNLNRSIGIATFIKPSQSNSIELLKDQISTFQSMLAMIGFILLGYLYFNVNYKKSNLFLKVLSILAFFALLRYLMIMLGIPQNIISSNILTDKFYYSDFGFGLAKSPMDLLITLIFISLFFLFFFRIVFESINRLKFQNVIFSVVIFIICVVGYVIALRGIGAAFRGIVFDTSLRYFQGNLLSLTFPLFIMQLNALLIGFISLSGSLILLLFSIASLQSILKKYSLRLTFIALSIFILSIAFIFLQKNPQLSVLLKILQILFVVGIFHLISKYILGRLFKIILFFVVSSIFSISALLHYNSQLEKTSLKTTAQIISRFDDEDWYKNLIRETLLDNFSRKEARNAFTKKMANYNSSAFKIWSRSQLQKEAINSSVNFLSLSGELLGGFGSIYPQISIDKFIDTNSVIEEIQIFEEATGIESQKLIRGIFPVKDQFAFLGYIDVSILSDLNDFGFSSHPEFISTGKLNEKAILKLDKLVILDYRDGDLKIVYGNLNPTQRFNDEIVSAKFTDKNDAWISSEINDSEYIIYVKRRITESFERIIAVALKNKELTIGLFDFFKIFFTHSIILLIILIPVFVFNLRKKINYELDLRSKLLLVFLIISVIPLILTALYFRNLTEDKNREAIYYKLGKRAFSIENYLNENYSENLYPNVFAKASDDLNISYTIYKGNYIFFSSQDLLYDVGLLPRIINPTAYNELAIHESQEILVDEAVDDYVFNSFYYKGTLRGEEIIIQISDGFNKIRLPLGGSEVDVFLFGFYSLTVILIVLFSAIFANQISKPIRKITQATKSVAAGDLSPELNIESKGEVKELIAGFQYMLKEIKKNQAELAEIEREAAWKEMAKQVAHEIKNPLTPMKLSIQQLITAYNDKSEKFDVFFNKVTGTILNQIETLKNIATEFSNFARMPKLKLEDFNVVEIIKQSVDLFTDENIEFVSSFHSNEVIVKGDTEQLKRTLINIIRNSIQAGSTKLELSFISSDAHYELNIKDNGIGIPSEDFDKIFEPNFTTKKEGMGLGLSMARRYMQNTGGDIKLIESNSEGSIFKIVFPKSL